MSFRPSPTRLLNQYEPERGYASVAGERRLWRAIIRTAFQDVEGLHVHGTACERKAIQVSAKRWFMSDCEEPGAFLWVCTQLGLDAGTIRRRLHELSRREFSDM
jgi:hypothetical protein